MKSPIRPLALAAGVLAATAVLGSAPALAEPSPAPSTTGGEAPAAGQAAPAPAAPAAPAKQSTRDAELEALKQTLEQLRKRIEELEKQKEAEKAKEPEKPVEPETAPPPPPSPPPSGGGGAGATFLPNISVIGNLIGRAGDTRAIPGRGRTHLQELEVAFQDAVAPKLRYDVFLAAEKEEDWNVHLEEGFLTATGPLKNLNIIAGRKRQRFGRLNTLHPHQWLFITQPTANSFYLGDHGLIADGALAQYILPTRGFYSAIEFGAWQTSSQHAHEEEHAEVTGFRRNATRRPRVSQEEEEHEELGFNGGENGAYSARVHLSKAIGRDREIELGASRYWGRGEVHDFGRHRLAVNGLDFSYRSYPGAYRRLWFLAELMAHETHDIGGDSKLRPGGYAMLAYRWNRYWEAGLRGDYAKLPFPSDGKEYGGSLFLTKYLTEQTSLRLEYRHERDSQFGPSNGIFFQLLFGSGPHTHEIQ